MKRVFLDANVLFSAAYREKSGLLRLWRLPGVELVTSNYASQGAASNLGDPEQLLRLAGLLKTVTMVQHTDMWPALPAEVELPDKDAPVLQAAMSAKAAVLLTGDVTHFGRYVGKTVGGVRVLPPASFLSEMEK